LKLKIRPVSNAFAQSDAGFRNRIELNTFQQKILPFIQWPAGGLRAAPV